MSRNLLTPALLLSVLSLTSCEIYTDGHHHRRPHHHDHGSGGNDYSSGRYDTAGVPIYGYENGRPIYGYTQVGRPVHALNQLYSGCYVPSWGRSSYHSYPHGVHFSAGPPRLYDNSNIEPGDTAPQYGRYYY